MATMKLALENSKVRNALILIYVLIVLGFSASARAEMSNFPIHKGVGAAVQMKTFVGEVAVTAEGQTYLIVSNELFYELQSNEDLSVFNGQQVQVQGYELMHKSGPVYQLYSMDPLSEEGASQVSAPVLVVLQISGLN
ncbi:MAG: hypothetical protein KF681_12570 [Bdellovibrionaceae bacterium]|nr:hypothetical protein [Pseudobdellovibrionaceae bacterium]